MVATRRGSAQEDGYGMAMTQAADPPEGPPAPVRQSGPVTLRGRVIPKLTEDQRLLDSRARQEWKTRDAWRALRIMSEFVEGFETLSELPPAVSVFGSARSKPDSQECLRACSSSTTCCSVR